MKLARLLAALLLLAVAGAAASAAGDTGTYEILDYRVLLTPHADGKVGIDCAQQWRVTGGHIPWITVGLPNENFVIMKWGGAARSISPANYSGWSGVRIDLDRDYQSGQTFAITFSVSQDRLFYAKDEDYRLDFTPGWYDRARISSLEVRLKSFAKAETVTADPQPSSISGDELVWTTSGLGPGERFSVSISFPKTAAPSALPEGSLRPSEEAPGPENVPGAGGPSVSYAGTIVIAVLTIVVIVYLIRLVLRGAFGGPYSGGSIFWGGGLPDWGDDSEGGHPRHTGGGGGFGGSGFSCVCACACVSCACACACAGGGGAGCSRKVRHRCAACDRLRVES